MLFKSRIHGGGRRVACAPRGQARPGHRCRSRLGSANDAAWTRGIPSSPATWKRGRPSLRTSTRAGRRNSRMRSSYLGCSSCQASKLLSSSTTSVDAISSPAPNDASVICFLGAVDTEVGDRRCALRGLHGPHDRPTVPEKNGTRPTEDCASIDCSAPLRDIPKPAVLRAKISSSLSTRYALDTVGRPVFAVQSQAKWRGRA